MNNKPLPHFFQKNPHQGFTAAELLLVIMILGVIVAIALPSLLSSKNKAISAEARNTIGAMNRSQQAYFLEKKSFASSIKDLQLGIKTQTTNYNYSTRATAKSAYNYAIARREYVSEGLFDRRPVKTYVGAVFIVPDPKNSQDELETVAIASSDRTTSLSR